MADTISQTPVYFFSHGGPNLMYDTKHPAYAELQKLGKEITGPAVRPKAVVAISAHWQANDDGSAGDEVVEVNFQEGDGGLIYDFYGFPDHYYDEKYPYKGSKELSSTIASALQAGGIKAKPVSRAIDHGVWVCFKVAFDPATNPLNVPLLQISLPPDSASKPSTYFTLGRALAPLRSQGILLIASGMPVHNLSSLRLLMQGNHAPLPYTKSFIESLEKAVTATGDDDSGKKNRENEMSALLKRADCKEAHPSLEHLWPIYVAAGAAGSSEKGVRIWGGYGQAGIGWGFYRWGDLQT